MNTRAFVVAVLFLSCNKEAPAPGPAPVVVVAKPKLDKIDRLEFNRRAAEHFLPIFWRTDANKNGALDPDELAFLWGFGDATRDQWVGASGFTDAFGKVYASLEAPAAANDDKRLAAIKEELSQGRSTLLESDFSAATAEDKAIVVHVTKAAQLVERLH